MYYVYLIRSEKNPKQKYVGATKELKKRLQYHNSGDSVHTSKYRPWVLITYVAMKDKKTAYDLERYLKTQSRRAFSEKRLW
jgi:putative endonuclease